MYFPYLRGRQYELIAIRELIEMNVLSKRVIPIIEPIKINSTFYAVIRNFANNSREIAIIINPEVGPLSRQKSHSLGEHSEFVKDIAQNQYVVKTVLSNNTCTGASIALRENGVNLSDVMSIYMDRDYVSTYESIFKRNARYNVVPYDPFFRRIRGNRILIADRFASIKKDRNADYISKVDEFFSDDHLYYQEENYCGYSDFSIIGRDYQETGFAPYAVAIHIVYFDDSRNLRIRHFVSDSNDDINDPANKFSEAVTKLVRWNQQKKLQTYAIKEFERLCESGAYPGLGVVKKLSLMHHFELMSDYLDGNEKW